jgi:coenzyme F420 hydrogenase subunit beta
MSHSPPPIKIHPAPHRSLCTDCGVSRLSNPKLCAFACQFIQPDYEKYERQVHGRSRSAAKSDEIHFGPFLEMHKASMKQPSPGAQWTGVTTSLAEQLLKRGLVDAVLTITADEHDRWRPVPILIDKAQDMVKARGMKMGYAPLLSLLEPALQRGYKRLAVIGIPCQIYALRALEESLGLEALYVIGTPCSDNTTTENFHQFLQLITPDPSSVTYLEFKANYHVELRFENAPTQEIPFLQLPLSDLPKDFFPLTCRTCVDYTNALADITVGYMAGQGEQWIIARNERGKALLELLGEQVLLSPLQSAGRRRSAVMGFKKNVELAAGGLPVRKMPNWLRPIVSWLMPKIGPRGLEFARTRVEMKAIEAVLHLRRELPKRVKHMLPDHVWRLAQNYGLSREEHERILPKSAERKI